MTMKVKDVPVGTEETPAMRLRQAREDKGFTRAELANRTGIPQKSIEKFENGSQEPTLSRLKSLSDALGVTTPWIVGSDDTSGSTTETNDIGQRPLNPPPLSGPEFEPVNDNDPMEQVRGMLEDLDDMRQDEFDGVQRHALALANEIILALKHFEPGELLELAYERGLYQGDCQDAKGILDIFAEDPDEGQVYCGNIEERIVDTAILGVDLYSLDRDALVDVAKALSEPYEFEQPKFFGWGDHSDFVPLIRHPMRAQAIVGKGYDLENTKEFPTRG